MTVCICDICKNMVSPIKKSKMTFVKFGYFNKCYEICDDCKRKIFQFIDSIQDIPDEVKEEQNATED